MPNSHIPHVRPRPQSHESARRVHCWLSILIMAAITGSAACRPVDQQATDAGAQDMAPDQEAWNTTIYLSRHGRQEATIKAGHRLYYAETNLTVMDGGIYVEFFEDDGSMASTLEAERGEIDGRTHDLRVWGEVNVYSAERGTLETDSLTWINAENVIETEAAVRLTRDRDFFTGDGFEADPAMRRWTIRRQIKGQLLPSAQPQ